MRRRETKAEWLASEQRRRPPGWCEVPPASVIDSGQDAQTASVQANLLGEQILGDIFGGGKLDALLLNVVGRDRAEVLIRERVDRAIALRRAERVIAEVPSDDSRSPHKQLSVKLPGTRYDLIEDLALRRSVSMATMARSLILVGLAVVTGDDERANRSVVVAKANGSGHERLRVRGVAGAR